MNPTKNLTALKVYGPIFSMPVSCAMKVVPQINVQKRALIIETDLDVIIVPIYKQSFFQDYLWIHW